MSAVGQGKRVFRVSRITSGDLILHGNIVLPDKVLERGYVLCREGRIEEVKARYTPRKSAVVTEGAWITPGFVDLHVHGGGGADYMDGTVDAVLRTNRAHFERGTTTIFPTTTTGSFEQIMRMLQSCAEARRVWDGDSARIAGIHLYGPYFAPTKVGCHSLEGRRDPSAREYEAYFKTGMIRIATCAAELPNAASFHRAARKAGCLITCGHSEATWTDMERAFKNGMRHVDHFWCAMSSVPSLRQRHGTPMQASMAEFVLANVEMSTEVIADGQHLSKELLEFAYRMKGASRLCLVTDANRALGMPPGRYRFGSEDDGAWFESDGKVGFVPGQGLASSVVGLDAMVRNMLRITSAPVADVVRMASLTPAERAGVAGEVGSLEVGKLADFVVFDAKWKVRGVHVSRATPIH